MENKDKDKDKDKDKERILQLEKENEKLLQRIKKLEQENQKNQTTSKIENNNTNNNNNNKNKENNKENNNLTLTDFQKYRYDRHIILDVISKEGQLKFCNSSVLIIGCGGLGSTVALYLTASGIGRIGLIDNDIVEESNLQRQIIHNEKRISLPKVYSAEKSCKDLNSTIKIEAFNEKFTTKNGLKFVKNYDVIIDCTDNYSSRYLINDACVLENKPLISGSSVKMDGHLTVYNYKNGPCYRCFLPKPPPKSSVSKCASVGVLGAVPGVIGCLQAIEALKVILNWDKDKVLSERMLIYNARTTTFRTVKLRKKNPKCQICGENKQITKLISLEHLYK